MLKVVFSTQAQGWSVDSAGIREPVDAADDHDSMTQLVAGSVTFAVLVTILFLTLPSPSCAQMMENPMMQQMMSSMMAQPGFMESIMASNPQLRSLVDANPQVRHD